MPDLYEGIRYSSRSSVISPKKLVRYMCAFLRYWAGLQTEADRGTIMIGRIVYSMEFSGCKLWQEGILQELLRRKIIQTGNTAILLTDPKEQGSMAIVFWSWSKKKEKLMGRLLVMVQRTSLGGYRSCTYMSHPSGEFHCSLLLSS
jgi:hypothetical protein